ncbi:MAG TPA: vWA domain-containing protein [Candidatus Bathyarchaeia archaeon]|nr:vWA domain-containing protein [Candidatus Bathyarchaeia archaeon]
MRKKSLISMMICIGFLTSLFINFNFSEALTETPQTLPEPKTKNDLLINFEVNQTIIGKAQGALGNLTLENTGLDPVGDIAVDFGFIGEYAEFSDAYPEHQETSLLNSGFSTSYGIEVILNESLGTSGIENQAADVCLMFDASGSMGDEIDSVKVEFLNIMDYLEQKIPSLRVGVIIYGWDFYSEYPQEHPENYRVFTDDFVAINQFIDGITVSGRVEPWGDALYLANSWSWREDVAKMIIMVGDENCDPGHIVGVSSTAEYYNGSQLLNVVTNLKEKGVIISTVRTGPDPILENQFTWIAEYTNGESVNLQEMQSLPEPIDLPELIQMWTSELSREYFVYLYANITWTEFTTGGDYDYETQESLYIMIDLAPPAITVTNLILLQPDYSYNMQIYAEIEDLSGVQTASLYYTMDDLDGPVEPDWDFLPLIDPVGDTYYIELTDLIEGQSLSYYIVAMDTMGNIGETVIYNETIEITPQVFGSTTTIIFLEDESSVMIYYDLEDQSAGYIWIRSNEYYESNIGSEIDFEVTLVYSGVEGIIYKIEKLGSENLATLTLSGNTTTQPIKIYWNYALSIYSDDYQNNFWEITDTVSNVLIQTTFEESKYLGIVPQSSELVAYIYLYDSDWQLVDIIIPGSPVLITAGTYFLWVRQIYRFGYFSLYFGDNPTYTTDPYYPSGVAGPTLTITMIIIGNVLLGILFISKKKVNKKKEAN